jgi:tetratricopeptide (TPR) repeat protein
MRTALIPSIAFIAMLAVWSASVAAQETLSAQQLFEAGQHDQALDAIAKLRERDAAGPADAFLAGQILVKMDQNDRAKEEFTRLAATGDTVWTLIGESATATLDHDQQRALDSATKAVAEAPDHFHAHYQLGLAKARFEDWAGCADAFARAVELNPGFAYAHYYAGLSYSRIKRADRTSEYFERFLKLAPNAPERAAIETLMRTLRGR